MSIKNFSDFNNLYFRANEGEINSGYQYSLPDKVKDRLTDDGKGNYVFFHYSNSEREFIKPTDGQGSLMTSREESRAIGSVGGVAMYYTRENEKEQGVGSIKHTVLIPKDQVYYFNEDKLNFYDEAREKFIKWNKGYPLAFDPNYQAAWIAKVANENGFKIIVCEWVWGKLRGQTTIPLKSDLIIKQR